MTARLMVDAGKGWRWRLARFLRRPILWQIEPGIVMVDNPGDAIWVTVGDCKPIWLPANGRYYIAGQKRDFALEPTARGAR